MIVLLGDSIRLGIQRNISKDFLCEKTIFGPAENLGDSRSLLNYVLSLNIVDPANTTVHFNSGLHDIRFHRDSSKIQIEIKEYQENLKEIIKHLKKLRINRIIIANTTSFKEGIHNQFRLDNNSPFARYLKHLDLYNEIVQSLANQEKIECNDLYNHSSRLLDSYLKNDGLHFVDDGYKLLSDKLINFLD